MERMAASSPYFHVVVWLNPAAGIPRLLFSDLSEAELKRNFLRPYRSGARIVITGEVIDLRTIASVKITKTERTKDDELDGLRRDSRAHIQQLNRESEYAVFLGPGAGYDDEDIAEAGEDVTTRYISTPPGSSSPIQALLGHPWIVGIGTAVIAALILTYAFGISA